MVQYYRNQLIEKLSNPDDEMNRTFFRDKHDTVDGTYTDAAGKDMYLFVEHKDHGLKMMGNYTFPSLTQTYMAPGGQTAFEDEDGKLYLVYHQDVYKRQAQSGTGM